METHGTVPPGAATGHLALGERELVEWGWRLGRAITPPLVIAISGDLGAGKTTLTQAICRGYGVTGEVTSPTFTLLHEYTSPRSTVFHLDLYRLKSPVELAGLGWDELLAGRALVIVEWADRAINLMPHGHVSISLSHVSGHPDKRVLYAGGHT